MRTASTIDRARTLFLLILSPSKDAWAELQPSIRPRRCSRRMLKNSNTRIVLKPTRGMEVAEREADGPAPAGRAAFCYVQGAIMTVSSVSGASPQNQLYLQQLRQLQQSMQAHPHHHRHHGGAKGVEQSQQATNPSTPGATNASTTATAATGADDADSDSNSASGILDVLA